MMEIGVANPRAQGHAMMSTAIALTRAWVSCGGGPSTNHAIAVNTSSLTFVNQSGNLANVGPQTPVASIGSLTQLPASGMDDFFVGGHFDVSPTTTTQAYTGTLTLSIDFN